MKLTKIFLAIIALFTVCCTATGPEAGDNGGSTGGNGSSTGGSTGGNGEVGNAGTIEDLIGAWELYSWSGSTTVKPKVYLELKEDYTFNMYQMASTIEWIHYDGTFTFEDSILGGVYSDGVAWSKTYIVDILDNPKRLRMANPADAADVAIYVETTIPTEVVEMAKAPKPDTQSTRSGEMRFL